MTSKQFLLGLAGAGLALLTTGCPSAAADGPARGKTLYANCVSCHGADGSGNHTYGAPAIAGMSTWYLEAQLKKFRSGARGTHPRDVEGMRMRPMSQTLASDADVTNVAAYVASLPARKPAPTVLDGNAATGAQLFATCTACHGATGAGNEALKAPPLSGNHDWYLLAQLRKFKEGVRGANPEDTTGALMRPMAQTLVDEQAMKNVVAHIMTLSR
ncbi:MAG: c-type cytochrome [Myxococcota bacterium]